jgi:hypothetical protein
MAYASLDYFHAGIPVPTHRSNDFGPGQSAPPDGSRLYAGGEYQFNASPSEVETRLLHGGVELRQRAHALRLGQVASVRLVAAGDVKAVEDLDWEAAFSVRGGFEISRAQESLHASRRWSVLAHFYDGPSPYGQFFRSNVRYYGVGLHFAL